MKVSKVALAAATMLGAPAGVPAAAAMAQPAQGARAGQAAQPQRQLQISRAEAAALQPLEAAVRAQDWAAAQAALPAAQAAARGPDARYFVARAAFQIGNRTNNAQVEAQALDTLIALPNTPPNEKNVFLSRRAELAFNANDFARAEQLFMQLAQLTPNNPDVQRNLSVVRSRMGNTAGALEPILQQIRAAEAAGQRAPESLYQRAVDIPLRARQRQQTGEALRNLARAYPSATNWRRAVDFARQGAGGDLQHIVDIFRFARAANVIQGQEYFAFATTLNQAGLPGETKAILDAGIAAGAVSRGQAGQLLPVVNRRIAEDRAGLTGQIAQARAAARGRQARVVADTLYGYGRYQEAADLYRAALGKGGEDANVVNTRLGAALALAGQRAAAETALRAVTGPRAELAQLWLTWLASRA